MRSTLTDDFVDTPIPVRSRDPLSHMTIHRYRVQPAHVGVVGYVDGARYSSGYTERPMPPPPGGAGGAAWPRR